MHMASKLFDYDPARPFGQRVVVVNTAGPFVYTSYVTMFFDPKRKRAVVVGGTAAADGQRAGISYYDFSSKPMMATRISAPLADRPPGGSGPGARYDPIADRYVIWNGGKTLTFIEPDTWAMTTFTPAGGDTPSNPTLGGRPGGGTWNRFFYSPAFDVFGVINHANEEGAFIFTPGR